MNLPAIRYDLKEAYFQIFEIQKMVIARRNDCFGYPIFELKYNEINDEYFIKYSSFWFPFITTFIFYYRILIGAKHRLPQK